MANLEYDDRRVRNFLILRFFLGGDAMTRGTKRFLLSKTLEMLLTLLVVTVLSFLLVRLSPPTRGARLQRSAMMKQIWRRCVRGWGLISHSLFNMAPG